MNQTRLLQASLIIIILLASLSGWIYWTTHKTLSNIEKLSFIGAKDAAMNLNDAVITLENLKNSLEEHGCSPYLLKENEPDSYVYFLAQLASGAENAQQMKRYVYISYVAEGEEPPQQLMDALETVQYYFVTLQNNVQAYALSNSTEPIDCTALPDDATIDQLSSSLSTFINYNSINDVNAEFMDALSNAAKSLPQP